MIAAVARRMLTLLSALLLIGMLAGNPPVAAEKKEQELQKLESKSESLEAKRRAIQQKKNEKLREANKMTSQIVHNQRKLNQAQSELYYAQNRLTQTRRTLTGLTEEIDRTIGETSRLNEDASKRLRQLYMGGRVNMLQMILEAEDIATFLDRIYYKQRIVAHDKKVLNDLRRKSEQLKHQREELARQQQYLGQAINNIEGLRTNIHSRLVHDKRLRDRYWKDAQYYEQAERELLAESARITSEIQRLTGGSNTTVASSTGSFAWPVIGRITSNFGYRSHPIHRKRLMHTGLDIAQGNGHPIKAADGGTVIFSGWRGGYGQAVIINHGNRGGKNLVTLYGHMSARSVSNGQTVSKGQVIGRVGSTGTATGPHLHFEIRVNGAPVDPRPYLN